MSKVNTVSGTISSSDLGRTRIHEHLLWIWPGTEYDPLIKFNEENTINAVTKTVLAIKKRGISTIVDATPMNLSRRTEFLKKVADATGMNIIAATGFSDGKHLPFYFAKMDVERLADIMEHEITKGISGTGVKAGVIKVGTGDTVVESEEKILRAAARVSKSTGVPIISHTDHGILGDMQIEILESEGVDLSHVVIGHTCSSSNIEYYLNIIERGAYAGFDRIGWTDYQRNEIRLMAIAGLICGGYAHRIVLSQDSLMAVIETPHIPAPQGENRWTYLEDEFIPRLLQAGIRSEIIEQILVNNPRCIFE
jgi:phosphotriesterase-related protein